MLDPYREPFSRALGARGSERACLGLSAAGLVLARLSGLRHAADWRSGFVLDPQSDAFEGVKRVGAQHFEGAALAVIGEAFGAAIATTSARNRMTAASNSSSFCNVTVLCPVFVPQTLSAGLRRPDRGDARSLATAETWKSRADRVG